MRFTTSEIAEAVGGTEHGPEATIDGSNQDSRSLEPGQLFIPLVAERDGHDFIERAVADGAGAYLTHERTKLPSEQGGATGVLVSDTNTAMLDLAKAARAKITGPVVGITGSVGKTSTKDLLAGAVAQTFRTHWSAKSFNNEIGVPLTILNAPDASEAVIIEMGARGIGHISLLCDIASPTVGIVTTVAGAHTGEFGSVENIAVAKGELIEALPANGLAVLNGDNPLVAAMADRSQAPTLTFGHDVGNDVRIESVELDDELRATFTIVSEWGRVTARPPTRGAHMATNTAAAVGTALWMGATPEEVEAGMEHVEVSPWRMDVRRSAGGGLVINDSYNANPTSMKGALDSLGRLHHPRKVAVLGYMGELGDDEGDDHVEVAEAARAVGAEIIAVGTDLYGIQPLAEPSDLLEIIGPIGEDVAVLVKGSRSAGLEVMAEALLLR